ncbi:MAG: amidohydrolase family protein [Kiloniellales bacterium]
MSISEFPLSAEVAADAADKGEHVVMGAPNVLRGGSHKGHLSAEEAVREGLCTLLASDYYYPSLLHAAEHLVRRGVTTLSGAWQLISANPAAAMGLRDCGAIAPGKRADVVVVDCSDRWRLVHAIVDGLSASYGR